MINIFDIGDIVNHRHMSKWKLHGNRIHGVILKYLENEKMYLVFVANNLLHFEGNYSLQYWFVEDVCKTEHIFYIENSKKIYSNILKIEELDQYVYSPYPVVDRLYLYYKYAKRSLITPIRTIQRIFEYQQEINSTLSKQGQLVFLKVNNIVGRLYSYYEENELGELELFTIGRWCYFFYKNETGQIVWSLVDPCEVDVCDIDEGYEDLKFEKYKDAINKYDYSFLQTREYLKKYCLLDPKVAYPFHNN